MQLQGRSFSSGNYRYGFNGKENDNEVKGEGNQIAYESRIYDSRIGKWFSVDPLREKYPMISPYAFAVNSPLYFIDVDGRDIEVNGLSDQLVRCLNKMFNGILKFEIVPVKSQFLGYSNMLRPVDVRQYTDQELLDKGLNTKQVAAYQYIYQLAMKPINEANTKIVIDIRDDKYKYKPDGVTIAQSDWFTYAEFYVNRVGESVGKSNGLDDYYSFGVAFLHFLAEQAYDYANSTNSAYGKESKIDASSRYAKSHRFALNKGGELFNISWEGRTYSDGKGYRILNCVIQKKEHVFFSDEADIYEGAKYDDKGNRMGGKYIKTVERTVNLTTGSTNFCEYVDETKKNNK